MAGDEKSVISWGSAGYDRTKDPQLYKRYTLYKLLCGIIRGLGGQRVPRSIVEVESSGIMYNGEERRGGKASLLIILK